MKISLEKKENNSLGSGHLILFAIRKMSSLVVVLMAIFKEAHAMTTIR
jgi:hypothetical protein